VSDDKVYQFISTPPVSEYFSDLICRLKDLCLRLDAFVCDKEYVNLNILKSNNFWYFIGTQEVFYPMELTALY